MKNKPVRLLLFTGGQAVKAYSVKAGGYTHLVIAPPNHLFEIEQAVQEAETARQVSFLQHSDATPLDIRLARMPDPNFEVHALEAMRYESVVILPSALKALQPETPKKRKAKKLTAAVPLKRAYHHSAATKAKLRAARLRTMAAKQQSSLLQAVENSGPDALPLAQPD